MIHATSLPPPRRCAADSSLSPLSSGLSSEASAEEEASAKGDPPTSPRLSQSHRPKDTIGIWLRATLGPRPDRPSPVWTCPDGQSTRGTRIFPPAGQLAREPRARIHRGRRPRLQNDRTARRPRPSFAKASEDKRGRPTFEPDKPGRLGDPFLPVHLTALAIPLCALCGEISPILSIL